MVSVAKNLNQCRTETNLSLAYSSLKIEGFYIAALFSKALVMTLESPCASSSGTLPFCNDIQTRKCKHSRESV